MHAVWDFVTLHGISFSFYFIQNLDIFSIFSNYALNTKQKIELNTNLNLINAMIRKFSFFTLAASVMMLASCSGSGSSGEISIVPRPVEVTKQCGDFQLMHELSIGVSDSSLLPAGNYLKSILEYGTPSKVNVVEGKGDIILELGQVTGSKSAYELNIDNRHVMVKANSYPGVIAAISTIRQLLPVEVETSDKLNESVNWVIPAVNIKDAPRFEWRGFMLDASRHFWNKEEVKHFLDIMALYKLNKFHWHLTDDQGWRIEIKKYPLLTEKGAWRKFDKNDRECMRLAAEEDNTDYLIPENKIKVVEGDTLYGGYYTQEDIKEVVAYAAQRGIDVIPEIDMPGHMLAAIGNYPYLACNEKIGWGEVFSSPLCPGKDSTLEFCKDVYTEVFQLFPYEYVNLGADEVEKINWKKCPDCNRRMKQLNLKTYEELQSWFVHDMEHFFNDHGKRLIGWDEIIEGGLSPTATVAFWRNWVPDAPAKATEHGNQVIVCPNEYLYLSVEQNKNSLLKTYNYEPVNPSLTSAQQELIIGVQGNIWAETIPSVQRVEYMMMPRFLALSEMAWVQPAKKDADDFMKRIVPQFKRMDKMNINYRIPDLQGVLDMNAFIGEGTYNITCMLPDVDIRYTTDGTVPTKKSPKVPVPLKITETSELTFRTFRPNGTAGDISKARFVKTDYMEADKTAKVKGEGLKAKWYDARVMQCADITKAPLNGEYTVKTVSIPEEAKGNIGLVMNGYLDIPEDGIYTFLLTSDDGSVLTIDGQLAIDNDGPHSSQEKSMQLALRKGLHPVEIKYFDSNGGMLDLSTLNEKGEKVQWPAQWLKH